MSSTLAHFLFWYINRGEHIRMTQIDPTIGPYDDEKYNGARKAQMNPNTRKYIPMRRMTISLHVFIFFDRSVLSPDEIKYRAHKQDDRCQYTQIG